MPGPRYFLQTEPELIQRKVYESLEKKSVEQACAQNAHRGTGDDPQMQHRVYLDFMVVNTP